MTMPFAAQYESIASGDGHTSLSLFTEQRYGYSSDDTPASLFTDLGSGCVGSITTFVTTLLLPTGFTEPVCQSGVLFASLSFHPVNEEIFTAECTFSFNLQAFVMWQNLLLVAGGTGLVQSSVGVVRH